MPKSTKPVGTSGVAHVKLEADAHSVDFAKVEFPPHKEGIEQAIVEGFMNSAREILPALAIPAFKQNAQDDFDFTLLLEGSKERYLELKEIAPLKSASYDSASSSYMAYEFAQFIREIIRKQSKRYEGSTGPGLYLLLYVTDWRFYL